MTIQCSTHPTLVRIALHLVATASTRLTAMASMVVASPFVGRLTVLYSMYADRVAPYTYVFVCSVTFPTAQSAVEHFPRALGASVTKASAISALVL